MNLAVVLDKLRHQKLTRNKEKKTQKKLTSINMIYLVSLNYSFSYIYTLSRETEKDNLFS